jgi:ZIP family zinc transporter
MFNWFINLNYIYQALIATLFTYLLTALGSGIVFLFKTINKTIMDSMLGFAAGVMIAASFFSLLSPAIETCESLNLIPWLIVTIGFILGGLLLFLSDKIFNKLLSKKNKRILMLVSSITIHNIPEGLAVGLAFGAAAVSGEPRAYYAALGLAIGMSVQNFPEGAAIALPMKVATRSKHKAFLFGMGSGAVEPLAAVVGYILASEVAVLHPWMLGFAAGAMIFVVAEDLIPDANINEYPHAGTWGVMLGFVLMMVLDVALG